MPAIALRSLQAAALLPLLTWLTAPASAQGCVPDWIPRFGGVPGMDFGGRALVAFDDGSGAGPMLYVGGTFDTVGGTPMSGLARWDGSAWSTIGDVGGYVNALTVHDDGSGPALYVGGSFQSIGGLPIQNLARWDGHAWSAFGGFVDDDVYAFLEHDDGSGAGPALYVAGDFTIVGGVLAAGIARWHGAGWSALGPGTLDVRSMTVFDDGLGGGPALYAAGSGDLLRWDGVTWTEVPGGPFGAGFDYHDIRAVEAFDDGGGEQLYVGGTFPSLVKRWDGRVWTEPGQMSGIRVEHFLRWDDGTGEALYVAGDISVSGVGSGVLRWDGRWSSVGNGITTTVEALAPYDDGSGAGERLFAAGSFQFAGDDTVQSIVALEGDAWYALGGALSDPARAFLQMPGVGGQALIAAGEFFTAGGAHANHVASFDGETWSALGAGVPEDVFALALFDAGGGAGPELYAGGGTPGPSGLAKGYVRRWDGAAWHALPELQGGRVEALAVFDDGGGPALYAGGRFTAAGGVALNHVARWDGASWHPLGAGMPASLAFVLALEVFDDGTGPSLFAGGRFTLAGTTAASHIARWDGGTWHAVGAGASDQVHALTAHDDGSGPAIYAGGMFLSAGGVTANRVARWDGQAWSGVGAGFDAWVNKLLPFDDGGGARLFAGGVFLAAEGEPASRVASWDGAAWSPLQEGVFGTVTALGAFDDGTGAAPGLVVSGEFLVGPAGDSHVGFWACSGGAVEVVPGCFGNPAELAVVSDGPSSGDPFALTLAPAQLASGVAVLVFGFDATDASGCGLLVPGVGELILGLAPIGQLGSQGFAGAPAAFTIPVPPSPQLVGAQAALHGVLVGGPGATAIELSNALVVTIAP